MTEEASTTKTIMLGNEYDDALRDALRAVLLELGASWGASTWGVGGSQMVETVEVIIDGGRLLVEAETYMGLSITGEEPLVSAGRLACGSTASGKAPSTPVRSHELETFLGRT